MSKQPKEILYERWAILSALITGLFAVIGVILSALPILTQDPPPTLAPTPSLSPTLTLTATLTSIASMTPSTTANQLTFTLFRDEDSLTIYIPEMNAPVSIVDLTFQIQTSEGTFRSFDIEKYSSFVGLPFSNIPTPICIRLTKNTSISPIPLECGGILMITQNLADADVFWFDNISVQDRTVLIADGQEIIGVCASGQAKCDILFIPPRVTPTSSPEN
jgi:hypothetical protein